jgi:hypothetical protein
MSGSNQTVFNTRERAISSDLNRAQAQLQRLFLEQQRHYLLSRWGGGIIASGSALYAPALDAPQAFEVAGGLDLDCSTSTTQLTIAPGMLTAISSVMTITADDSPLVLAALTSAFTGLDFVANASGSVRVDIIECQIVATTLETSNRDVYNVATGTYTPALVTKQTGARLAFRLRTGTPGAGLPALQSGWYPLFVAVVGNGALNYTEVEFYDVRPLACERSDAPGTIYPAGTFNTMFPWGDVRNGHSNAWLELMPYGLSAVANPSLQTIRGLVQTTFGGYWGGGALDYATCPRGNLASFTDIACKVDTDHLAGAYGASQALHFWIAFPGGLPRWAKFSRQAATYGGTRKPGGFRGLFVLSADPGNCVVNNALGMPVSSGFTTAPAVAVGGTWVNTLPLPEACCRAGDVTRYVDGFAQVSMSSSDTNKEWHVVGFSPTVCPAGARGVRVRFEVSVTAPGSNPITAIAYVFAGSGLAAVPPVSFADPYKQSHAAMEVHLADYAGPNARLVFEVDIPFIAPAKVGANVATTVVYVNLPAADRLAAGTTWANDPTVTAQVVGALH